MKILKMLLLPVLRMLKTTAMTTLWLPLIIIWIYEFCRKQPEVLEVLAKHNPNLVNATNSDKATCLHMAVFKQCPTCVQVLLKYNADVNLQASCCICYLSFNNYTSIMHVCVATYPIIDLCF